MVQKKTQLQRAFKLALCLVLAVAALLAAASITSYVNSVKTLVRSTTANNISELTVSKAQYLDERLRSERLALQSLAGLLGGKQDTRKIQEQIRVYQDLHDASCMWIFDTQGNGWSTSGNGNLYPPSQTEELFAAALRGETGISEVFIGALGKRQVLIYTPIIREDRVVGGLYESYPAELLQNTYGGGTYNDAGYSYVLGQDGSVVLASVRFSYLQIYTDFREILADGGNSPEAISAFMDALAAGKKGSATFLFEDEMQFLSFTPLSEKDGWYFVTVIPLSSVERDGTEIVRLTVRMAAVLVAAVIVIFLLLVAVVYYRNKKRREYELYLHNTYEAISQNIDTVIFIVDAKTGRVEHAFENAHKVLGIPARDFYHPEDTQAGEFENRIFDLLRTERPQEKTSRVLTAYNNILAKNVWLEVTALPVTLLGSGKYIFAVTDITQDRQIQENLSAAVAAAEQANTAKSLFFSNMSHDIRTPMNAIVGMTKLAKIYISDQSRVEDCLHKIELSSRHLLGLINDVLDMSKIESGKMTLALEPFFLSELVESALVIVQPQCRAKNLRLNVETKDVRHEALLGDPLRLNQVMLNLTSNAVKFTPEGGEITLSIQEFPQRHQGYAAYRVCVRDTGVGIAPEFLPNIFHPFERESTKSIRQIEGTGLGLAIAKNIVEALGGMISVESTLGKGTLFTVDLELTLQPDSSEEEDAILSLTGRRALVADDSEADLSMLALNLSKLGFGVDTAASGEEALEIVLDQAPYDLIMLDWKLPGMDGEETARKIRAAGKGSPRFVLVTAFDASAVDTPEIRQAFDLILQKPIFKNALCKRLSLLFSAEEQEDTEIQNVCQGKRFLLVEDNEINREIATELLALSGASVECAVDGELAVAAFLDKEAGYYDAIFMDIQMPNMDGYEATRRIRASGHPGAKEIPIIAMSANVFAEDVRASLAASMNAHLGKPIVIEEIYRTLKEWT